MTIKRILCLICAVSLMLTVTACSAEKTEHNGSEKISVVTTAFPEYDFCRQVAGETAEITMLLLPGEEVHSFDPTPRDILAIKNADVFVYGGGESDSWVNAILGEDAQKMNCVSLMEAIENSNRELETNQHSHGTHEHEEYDEHVWTSPVNAAVIAQAIAQALIKADPSNDEVYSANCRNYIEKLNALDAQFREITNSAKRNTLVFADRFPLLYFAREYNLECLSVFPGCAAETEANPKTLADIISKVESEKIPVVFKIEMSNNSMAKTVSNQTGAEILTFYSCQTVSKDDFEAGETYLSLMQRNVEALKTALDY